MPEFDSPLGRKQMTGSPRKVLTVEDETWQDPEGMPPAPSLDNFVPEKLKKAEGQAVQLSPDEFRAMHNKRQEILANQNKITGNAKERLNLILNIGRVTKDVPIDEHTFTLQSLKDKELREVVVAASKVENGAETMFEMRLQTLARSLKKFDGHEIGLVLGNPEDSVNACLAYLEEADEQVVNKLYEAYSEMMNQKKVASEEAKDLVNEIKK